MQSRHKAWRKDDIVRQRVRIQQERLMKRPTIGGPRQRRLQEHPRTGRRRRSGRGWRGSERIESEWWVHGNRPIRFKIHPVIIPILAKAICEALITLLHRDRETSRGRWRPLSRRRRGTTTTGAAARGVAGRAPPCTPAKGVESKEDPQLPPLMSMSLRPSSPDSGYLRG